MQTNLELPDELIRRARIVARKRGSSIDDLVSEALRRLFATEFGAVQRRMTDAPIKLPPGCIIPLRSDSELGPVPGQGDFE